MPYLIDPQRKASIVREDSALYAAVQEAEAISGPHFFNPFSGKVEAFRSEQHATSAMLKAAADRIIDLEKTVSEIRSLLDTNSKSGAS
ncbi:hypothetical protein LZK73_18470 [Neorhizobium galegae]|nr:hypothetical protein LZK73_18470 [Neorhizobium galegae]